MAGESKANPCPGRLIIMTAILTLVCTYLGKAGIIAAVMGIMTRVLNIWIRAWSGKEDIL